MFSIEVARPGSPAADSIVTAYFLDIATRWHGRPATPEEVDRALRDEPYDDLRDDTGRFLIATEGGEAIACAGVRFGEGGTAELTKVYTLPRHRGKGAGAQLLRAVELVCREQAISTLRLETRAELHEACALYEGRGFVRVDAFNDGPYSDRWYSKDLSSTADPR